MRIQHNIMAMNAYRNYNTNTSALSKNLEKLSSGYKINRAGDDAAGLAISEKMRAQITGLSAAQKNVKDGISLVKTAEGAMQEIQDMLNRMDYLATQSANGTYDNEVDRKNLQKEVDQLLSEINRIADSSNFNGIKLLDGSLQGDTVESEVVKSPAQNLTILSTAGSTVGTNTILHEDAKASGLTKFSVDLNGSSFTVSGTGGTITLSVGGASITMSATSDMNAEELATGFAEAMKDKLVTIGANAKFEVTAEGDKLIFTMDAATAKTLTSNADFTGNFAVTQFANATGTNGGVFSGKINQNTTVITEGSANSDVVLANTQTSGITLNADWVTDGKAIQVGDETYVFALTDKTANAKFGEGYKVVDVRDLVDPTTKGIKTTDAAGNADNTYLSEVFTRLSEVAKDNKMFSVGVNIDGASIAHLSFQEKSTYDGDADLKTVEGIQKQLQFFDNISVKETTIKGKGAALQLQIGDTSDTFNQLKVSVGDMHTAALGIEGLDISNPESASTAIQTIKDAINSVSSVRGDLGAYQNRLEHTANNLSVMAENIQDAESTIRDTDVAEEMMAYTKNNILIQSAQAMLAQANAVPQGVLQLLG